MTALPDNTTCALNEESYGCEIVVRPDTIVYLALGIAEIYKDEKKSLLKTLAPTCNGIKDWEEIAEIKPRIKDMTKALDNVFVSKLKNQTPFLMQPIWKTVGKSGRLADQCLDIFVWSDFSFTRLFIDIALKRDSGISRPARSVVWLYKMLYDFSLNGGIDFQQIIDRLTYNTKNDKAFAVSGIVTNPYMRCSQLTTPRIHKAAIKEIILGGGQNFLSPERRLDAIILNTPGLFD